MKVYSVKCVLGTWELSKYNSIMCTYRTLREALCDLGYILDRR